MKAFEEWLEKNYVATNLIIFITIAIQVFKIVGVYTCAQCDACFAVRILEIC